MKKIFLLILVSLALTKSVKAELLYYTFEGEVYYSVEKKVKEKDKTKIVFAVEFDSPGFYRYSDPSLPDILFEDYLDDTEDLGHTVDYFYSDVVSGLMIPVSILDPEIDYHLGASYVSPIATSDNGWGFITGGNDKDFFCILSSNSAVNTWKIKDEFDGLEGVLLSDGSKMWIYSDLVLTSISDSYVAPESPISIYTPSELSPPTSTVPEPPISLTLPLSLIFISGIYVLFRKKPDADESNYDSCS